MEILFTQLRRIRFWRNLELPLGIGCGVMLLLAALPLSPAWGVGAGLLGFMFGLWPRRTLRRTAAELDRELGAGNRLEAAVEMRKSSHVLRAAQLADAEMFWKTSPRSGVFRLLRRPFAVFLLWLSLLGAFTFVLLRPEPPPVTAGDASSEGGSAELKKRILKVGETPSPPPVIAGIGFTYPEEDPGLTPIDLAEFEAKAVSSAVWEKFTLTVARNGETVRTVPLAVPPPENGITFLSDAVALDELSAEPRDLIAIRLSGETGGGRPVYAPALYFRLKPLHEDILVMDGASGKYKEVIDKISEFLRRQIELARLLTLGRTALGLDPGADQTPFGELCAAQRKLRDELVIWIAEERDRTDSSKPLTVAMFQSLTRSGEEMERAAALLGRAPATGETLGEAAGRQEKAIARLSEALREVVKVISRKPVSGSPSKERKKPQENPGKLLEQALVAEEEVAGKAVVPELPSGLDKVQAVATWCLKMVTARPEIPDEVIHEAQLALNAGLKCEEAIRSSAPKALKLSADAALESIRKALEALRKSSARSAGGALDEARSKLAEAERKANSKGASPAGDEVEKKMHQAAGALKEAAQQNRGAGDGAQADKLDAMAAAIEAKAKGAGNRPGEGVGRELRELRREIGKLEEPGNGRDPGKLAKTLDALKREANYHARRGWKEGGPWRNALERALEGAGMYWNAHPDSPERKTAENALMPLQTLLADFDPEQGLSAADFEALQKELELLRLALEAGDLRKQLPTAVYMFTPDRIPEEYREAAARYFETLSRLRSAGGGK